MELIARDGRIVQLAEIAQLGDDAAHLVVHVYGGAQLLLGKIDAVHAPQRLYYLLFYLAAVVPGVPFRLFQRHVDEAGEKLLLRDELAVAEVLLHAVHGRAAFLPHQRVYKIIAALKGAFKNALGVRAGAVRHIICGEVGIRAAGRAQTYAEAALHIQQHLRNVQAVVGDGVPPLGTCLLHQFVVRLPQQVFKKEQMLKISQWDPSFRVNIQDMSMISVTTTTFKVNLN